MAGFLSGKKNEIKMKYEAKSIKKDGLFSIKGTTKYEDFIFIFSFSFLHNKYFCIREK